MFCFVFTRDGLIWFLKGFDSWALLFLFVISAEFLSGLEATEVHLMQEELELGAILYDVGSDAWGVM